MSLKPGNVQIPSFGPKGIQRQWLSPEACLQRSGLTLTEISNRLRKPRQTVAKALYWDAVADRTETPKIEPQRLPYAGK